LENSNKLKRQVFFEQEKYLTLLSDLPTYKIHGFVNFKAREMFTKLNVSTKNVI